MIRSLLLGAVCLAVLPRDATGYAAKMHEELTERALPGDAWLLTPLALDVVPGSPAAFRQWLYGLLSTTPDEALRRRFVARWPTAQRFDALALRELLLLNIERTKRVTGIDRVDGWRGKDARQLLAASSAEPDRDERNRDRLAHDPVTHEALKDAHGRPVPYDPATLNMGSTTGLSSQAHAHYGLPALDFSDDPDVLKSAPERFLIKAGYPPGPVLTLAAEMAQEQADLAVLATLWGGPGSRALAVGFAGQALHYVEDVGNQIHTVQVGSFDFFLSAKLQYWWRALITSGGYLAPLRPFASIGLDILSNHHLLIEQLTARRFEEALAGTSQSPDIQQAVTRYGEDDPDFAKALDAALATAGTSFAAAIAKTLIDASSTEGPKAYAEMRQAGLGRLSRYGFVVPEEERARSMDPDSLVAPGGDLTALYALQARAFRRVGTAVRRFDRELGALAGRPEKDALAREIASRLLGERLAMLEAAEARRADYVAHPPPPSFGTIKEPSWLISELTLLGLLCAGLWWRGRRGRGGHDQKGKADPNVYGEHSPDISKEENMS